MNDEKAASILLNLSKKSKLTKQELEALSTAVGILSWTKFAQSNLKKMSNKIQIRVEKSLE